MEAHTVNKLHHIQIDERNGENLIVCEKCGEALENLKITACETGCYYCSDECAKEDVKDKAPEGGY